MAPTRVIGVAIGASKAPELLAHRLKLYEPPQRRIFGANTYRAFSKMRAPGNEGSDAFDPWVTLMTQLPLTVISTTLKEPLDWADAEVIRDDAVTVIKRLKQQSDMPLRSHGSLSMNRALMAAELVDYVQVTLFPVITGQTGEEPIFKDAQDFDLQLVERRTLGDDVQELIYRPTLHRRRAFA